MSFENSPEIYSQLFGFEPSRSQTRQMQIIRAAIKCYSSIGVEKTTYDRIAKEAKLSRPLIQRYFADKEEVFLKAIDFIRANLQQKAIQAIDQAGSPSEKVEAYIRSCFRWIEQYPDHAALWVHYLHKCKIDKKLRKRNSELVKMGHDRIEALVKFGIESKQFSNGRTREKAKLVQSWINAGLLQALSENEYEGSVDLESLTVHECLAALSR